jgi:hypothetical protein
MKEFLKNTIVGGAVFLLPVALVGFILSRALRLTKGVAEPLQRAAIGSIGQRGGMGAAAIPSVLMLVLSPSLALPPARRRQAYYPMVEKFPVGSLPQYHLMKSMAEGLAHLEARAANRRWSA